MDVGPQEQAGAKDQKGLQNQAGQDGTQSLILTCGVAALIFTVFDFREIMILCSLDCENVMRMMRAG